MPGCTSSLGRVTSTATFQAESASSLKNSSTSDKTRVSRSQWLRPPGSWWRMRPSASVETIRAKMMFARVTLPVTASHTATNSSCTR
ncbi:hypothetical protein D3C71_707280 [compost metagenome]